MKIITIGRDLNNDIIIEDERVSRHHLQLVERDGTYQAVDLDSTNGTVVNGRRIRGAVSLDKHDTIRIGNTDLLWQAYFEKNDVQGSVDLSTEAISGALCSSHSQPDWNRRRSRGRRSRLWPILIVIVVIVFIGVGVNTWFNYQSGKSLDERASALGKRMSEQQPLQSKEGNSQEEFQRLYEEAILSQRDVAIAKAKAAKDAQENAEIAKQEADSLRKRAEKEAQRAQNSATNADKRASNAEIEKGQALRAKAVAEEAKGRAEKLKNRADSLRLIAEKAQKEVQEQLELTRAFYKACSGLKKSHYETLCKQWNSVAKGEEAQSFVEMKFEQADAKGKRDIINVINKLKKEAPSAPADVSETESSENNQ